LLYPRRNGEKIPVVSGAAPKSGGTKNRERGVRPRPNHRREFVSLLQRDGVIREVRKRR